MASVKIVRRDGNRKLTAISNVDTSFVTKYLNEDVLRISKVTYVLVHRSDSYKDQYDKFILFKPFTDKSNKAHIYIGNAAPHVPGSYDAGIREFRASSLSSHQNLPNRERVISDCLDTGINIHCSYNSNTYRRFRATDSTPEHYWIGGNQANNILVMEHCVYIPSKLISISQYLELRQYLINPNDWLQKKKEDVLQNFFDYSLRARRDAVNRSLNNAETEYMSSLTKLPSLRAKRDELAAQLVGLQNMKSEGMLKAILKELEAAPNVEKVVLDQSIIKIYIGSIICTDSSGRGFPIIIDNAILNIVLGAGGSSGIEYIYTPKDSTKLIKAWDGKKIVHPHCIYPHNSYINGGFTACLGNAENLVRKLASDRDVIEYALTLIDFLRNYNSSDSAGNYYNLWPKA